MLVAYLAGHSSDLEERSLRAGGGASTRRQNCLRGGHRWRPVRVDQPRSGLLAVGASAVHSAAHPASAGARAVTGTVPLIVVPRPGADAIPSWPPTADSRSAMPCKPVPCAAAAGSKPAPSSATLNRASRRPGSESPWSSRLARTSRRSAVPRGCRSTASSRRHGRTARSRRRRLAPASARGRPVPAGRREDPGRPARAGRYRGQGLAGHPGLPALRIAAGRSVP